jgi:hypothetical protein
LQGYVLGNALTNANLVSFTYTSNLVSMTITQADTPTLTGTIPASLPSAATVQVYGFSTRTFSSGSDGSWRVGYLDDGTSGSWSSGASPSAAPAPSTALLCALGLLLAGAGALLARRARAGSAN